MRKTCVAVICATVLLGLGLYWALEMRAVLTFPSQRGAGAGYARPERFGVASLNAHWWYAGDEDNERILGIGLDWWERESSPRRSWTAPDVSEWWCLIVFERIGPAIDLELVARNGERTWWRLDSATGAGARLDKAPSQRPALTLNSLDRVFVELE